MIIKSKKKRTIPVSIAMIYKQRALAKIESNDGTCEETLVLT